MNAHTPGYIAQTVMFGLDAMAPEVRPLYVAAPELLALVQRAVDIADGKAVDRHFEDDCRAALAKAKGKA